jgi:hypothetical protein
MLRKASASAMIGAGCLLAAAPAHAGCSASANGSVDLGAWTSGQVSAGVAETVTAPAGVRCQGAVLTLLSGNYVNGKVHSENGFKLVSGTSSASYVASATPNGSRPIAQDSTVNYADPVLLGLLGLGNSSDVRAPISFASFSGGGLPSGTYVDTITIDWSWRTCEGLDLLGLACVLYSTGTGRTVVTLSMVVTNKAPVVTIATRTLMDPVRGSDNPKAIPGASTLSTVQVVNPDVVALTKDTVVLTMAVPARLIPALEAVAGQPSAFHVSEGASDGMGVSYLGPANTTDDIEFSCDDGRTWTCAPAAASAITGVRIKVRGALKPSGSVAVQMAYRVK